MRIFFWNPIAVLLWFFSSSVYAEPRVTSSNPAELYHHQPLQYGSFYTRQHVRVPPEYGIPFDQQTVFPASGIHHVPGSAEFFIRDPGIYRVIYSVSLKNEGGRVALQLNDAVIPGSEMCIGEDNHLSTLGVLIEICEKSCCDHKLRIINNYPASEVGWYSQDICLSSCCKVGNITASIEIERIANCSEAPAHCCEK